jgi:glutamate dehydrogenase/leucine dehydrogenase
VSAYIEAAVQRQIERDNLDELIAAAEAEHGPITAEEIEVKHQQLAQLRGSDSGPAA